MFWVFREAIACFEALPACSSFFFLFSYFLIALIFYCYWIFWYSSAIFCFYAYSTICASESEERGTSSYVPVFEFGTGIIISGFFIKACLSAYFLAIYLSSYRLICFCILSPSWFLYLKWLMLSNISNLGTVLSALPLFGTGFLVWCIS